MTVNTGFTLLAQQVRDLKRAGFTSTGSTGSPARAVQMIDKLQRGETVDFRDTGSTHDRFNGVLLNAAGVDTLHKAVTAPDTLSPSSAALMNTLKTIGTELRPYDFRPYTVSPELATATLKSGRSVFLYSESLGHAEIKPQPDKLPPPGDAHADRLFDTPETAVMFLVDNGISFKTDYDAPGSLTESAVVRRLRQGQSVSLYSGDDKLLHDGNGQVRIARGNDFIKPEAVYFKAKDLVKMDAFINKLEIVRASGLPG